MVYGHGRLVIKRSRVLGLCSIFSRILVGKSINCVWVWLFARASYSKPVGFVLLEKDNQLLLLILKSPSRRSSLGMRLSWRILSDLILNKSESLGQLGDRYMTKINFLWCGRDTLNTELKMICWILY